MRTLSHLHLFLILFATTFACFYSFFPSTSQGKHWIAKMTSPTLLDYITVPATAEHTATVIFVHVSLTHMNTIYVNDTGFLGIGRFRGWMEVRGGGIRPPSPAEPCQVDLAKRVRCFLQENQLTYFLTVYPIVVHRPKMRVTANSGMEMPSW